MTEKPEFQLGIAMAGAISAGAYSAGVMDFFIEALDAYEAAKVTPDWTGPTHDVRIPVMTGASAGGMTAAIAALHAFHGITPVRPGVAPPLKPANRLYSSWVTDISIEALLETSDLKGGKNQKGVTSALCCDVLTRIVDDAFNLQGMPRERNWIGRSQDRSLRVMFTLTNLRGVPYSFAIFGSKAHERYGMLNHGDYLDFSVGMPGPRIAGSHALDVRDFSSFEWKLFKTAALATGAFPIGLAPRHIERPPGDYNEAQLVGFEDQTTGTFKTIDPDHAIAAKDRYPFVSVDGGITDNEPLELARRYLANLGHNDQNGETASKAVVLVAPFPNFVHVPDEDPNDLLIHVLPKFLSTLVEQAHFKPDELAKAENDKIFSRFMISPIRPAAVGNPLAVRYPIASGTLGGFGGFLHESFRRHDYLLGRRNAQAFLRWTFALPETNPLFNSYQHNRAQWYVRNVEGATGSPSRADEARYELNLFAKTVGGEEDTFGLPIIPLTNALCEPIEIGARDLPKPEDVPLEDLNARIRARAKAVVTTLVDIDLLSLTQDMWFGSVLRPVASKYATEIAATKAGQLVKDAVDCVKSAFK